jgi:signal transduction histidine kinase/ActR/RegA family two-component response regulator
VQGQLIYEPDISRTAGEFTRRFADAGLGALVISPLLAQGTVFGVLIAARKEANSFSSKECEFLRQLSDHVALATHQAQLYTTLQQAYDDLQQSQQTVMQQERLRALGQMASGVAHDINNAIAPIALYTDSLLEHETGLTERARGYLSIIRRAIADVGETVKGMREFYRPQERQATLTRIDLNPIVAQVIELTRVRWRDLPQQRGVAIAMRTQLQPALPAILGQESEIRDALTNLIFNAVDAMPEGGTLTMRTRGSAETVQLEVADSGTGMDGQTRRRCLEPFFTTKGERGTGLGLAMVYGMVRRHSAELEIDSTLHRGTIMRIVFPAAQLAAAAAPQPAILDCAPRPLSILIIDDDPLVLESLQATLQRDGHKVTAADGGQAGIDTFAAARQRNQAFDVVITDLGMPHVDGRRVAAAIKAAAPSTPVVLLTGWGQRLVEDGDIPAHVDHVLNKPPKLSDLRAALSRIVE